MQICIVYFVMTSPSLSEQDRRGLKVQCWMSSRRSLSRLERVLFPTKLNSKGFGWKVHGIVFSFIFEGKLHTLKAIHWKTTPSSDDHTYKAHNMVNIEAIKSNQIEKSGFHNLMCWQGSRLLDREDPFVDQLLTFKNRGPTLPGQRRKHNLFLWRPGKTL